MLSKQTRDQLFKSKSYRHFLGVVLKEFASSRGYKKRLADSAGCQAAYFSQVMAERTQLTPEQAERLCSFWELSSNETDFFFHLVLLGRAGSHTLKRLLERKLEEIRERWQNENQSFGTEALSEPERAAIYYSHWMHSAIHLLLTVPGFNTTVALATHFKISTDEVQKTLDDLVLAGLVVADGSKWRTTQSQIHAPQKDFFAEIHHKNWRSQAIEVRSGAQKSVVRYTSVHTLSEEDVEKLKNIINQMIHDSRRLIEPSVEEVAACLVVDYFKV
ncbi:MAG: TIGR02147 family protein [Bdellovibrionota bacterium]